MSKEEKDRFQICELFMATAGKERFFTGIIRRGNDDTGNPVVFSKICMPNGYICAQASTQKELSKNLNEMCKHVLDNEIHEDAGATIKIFDTDFFLN